MTDTKYLDGIAPADFREVTAGTISYSLFV
jgi:hypothetical protein